jgi:hypothetical protein
MARAIEGSETWDGYRLNSFLCTWCNSWHIGHPMAPESLAATEQADRRSSPVRWTVAPSGALLTETEHSDAAQAAAVHDMTEQSQVAP